MEEEQVAARAALLKFGAFALAIVVVLGLGTFLLVRALGLGGGSDGSSGGGTSAATSVPSQLPTVAISSSGSPSASPSDEPSPSDSPTQGIQLTAPAQAGAGTRIYLTGQYPGADGVTLQVQRQTAGAWSQFADVAVTVRAGSFSTYIITTQRGPTSFRLMDPATGQASNVVSVTIS